MTQTQQTEQWKVLVPCETDSKPFESEEEAKEGAEIHEKFCDHCDEGACEVVPASDDGGEQDSDDTDDAPTESETVEAEVIDHTPDAQATPNTSQDATSPDNSGVDLPDVNHIEETTQDIITQLDHADMTRLVWDPDADADTVPYDPSYLPYDRPEPSAEAYDMFATIIEREQTVRYSVVDVEFTEGDDTLGCTVTLEKHTGQGTKRLVGVKTRTNTNKDHWRERLYSKARRNALKQDIPPTWVSALLRKYKTVTDQ